MFSCPLCTKTFRLRSGLNGHLSVHNNERPYKCPKCPTTCRSSSHLQAHIKFVHNGAKRNNIKCPTCSFTCGTKSEMERHAEEQSHELPISFSETFQCSLCSKTYKTRYSLNRHTSMHNNERPHKCPHCPATFRIPWSLKNHVNIVHEGIRRNNLKCPTCSFACGTKSQMDRHGRTHWVERPFACTVPGCGFKTKTEKYLPIHHRRVHELQERLFECQVVGCNFKAKCLDTLRDHAFTHSNERPFSCTFPECDYSCKRKIELKGHTKRVHCDNAEKPFKCSTCDFSTKYALSLRQHEDNHKTNFKRFPCKAPNCSYATNNLQSVRLHFDSKHRTKNVACTAPGCNYKCGSIILLKQHARTHVLPIQKCPSESCNYSTRLPKNMRNHIAGWHKELKTASEVKSVKPNLLPGQLLNCSYTDCKYQTEFPNLYDRHMKTHEDDDYKNFCQFCYLRFKNVADLERHVQSHTKEKPYSCSLCNFTTVTVTYLRLHAKHVHGIDVFGGSTAKGLQNNQCRVCKVKFSSSKELVLHSMSHLIPVVVLKRLNLVVL